MTALTPDNARPGLRVKCVIPNENCGFIKDYIYLITEVDCNMTIRVDGSLYWGSMSRFVLAEPARPTLRAILAEHDPEFLAAVDAWRADIGSLWRAEYQSEHALIEAYERANLHAPAEVQAPDVTDARATLDPEWWA